MSNIWKVVLLGIAGLVLAGAAIGIVAAQDSGGGTSTPPATPSDSSVTPAPSDQPKDALRDSYLSHLAENLGISQAGVEAALRQTALDMVDDAVANGNLTEDEAATIRDRINSGDAPFFGFGPGFGHHGGPGHRFGFGAGLDEIAGFLGVDVSDITSGLQNNQSLAQIAEAHGKTAAELSAFLLDQLKTKLADAVTNNRITQDKADEILANAPARIDDLINHQGLPAPHRGGPGRFPFAPDGDMDDDSATPPDASTTPEIPGIVF